MLTMDWPPPTTEKSYKLLNKLVEAFHIVDIKHENDFQYLKMKFHIDRETKQRADSASVL